MYVYNYPKVPTVTAFPLCRGKGLPIFVDPAHAQSQKKREIDIKQPRFGKVHSTYLSIELPPR